MNIKLLSQKYAEEDLDLEKAIKVWKEARLAPENIREQVQNDVGVRISAIDAKELYKLGETKQTALKEFGMSAGDEKNCPFYAINYFNQNKDYGGMEVTAKDYIVSEGRSDLLPFNLKNNKKIKVTPEIRKAFDRVGENLFRDKFAAKYWTLKEKMGEDGKKSVYLVAIETPDVQVKHASIKEADVYVDPDQATETPEAKASMKTHNLIKDYGREIIAEDGGVLDTIGNAASTAWQGIKDFGAQGGGLGVGLQALAAGNAVNVNPETLRQTANTAISTLTEQAAKGDQTALQSLQWIGDAVPAMISKVQSVLQNVQPAAQGVQQGVQQGIQQGTEAPARTGIIKDYGREIIAQGTPSTTAPTNEQSNAEVSPQGTRIKSEEEKKKEYKPATAIEEGI